MKVNGIANEYIATVFFFLFVTIANHSYIHLIPACMSSNHNYLYITFQSPIPESVHSAGILYGPCNYVTLILHCPFARTN